MPTSARKSSVGGARRGPQKAHIPYRGDNPEVGKKTGIAVQHVERKSDGFEPFEEILQQADGRTPPRPKGRKRSSAFMGRRDDDYDDEDGEQTMELDSPNLRSLMNLRPPTTPTTAGRSRSSIRPVARTSDVDFDKIPSPRPHSSAQRTAKLGAAGPSSLRKSRREPEPEADSESENEAAGDYNGGDYDMDQDPGGFDDYGPQEDSPPNQRTPRQSNFGRIEEEDEEQEEEEEEEEPPQETPTRNRPDKGKKKAVREETPDQEEEVEDEIAQGLEDVGLGPDSEEEQSEQEPEPPVKKTKVAQDKKGKAVAEQKKPVSKTSTKSKKENRPQREGIRKSKREHFPPLEYWRGEKVVYGRTEHSGPVLVPPIREIRRIPKDETIPLGAKRKRGSTRARSRSRQAVDPDEYDVPPPLPVVNPEEGWDDETQALCTVLHFTTKEEVERRIAWTAKMVEPKLAADRNWSFDKIFGDDDFIAAGQLIIPPRGRKPSKAAKDNTYVFYVIEGAVNFKVHETSMILTSGGMFMVPRGNTYLIENICERNAKLFFTQARKVDMNKDEKSAKADHVAEAQRRKSLVRSSSAGAPSTSAKAAPAPNGRAVSMAVFPSTRKS
ncbi:hypothetical protein GALMADRAFT_251561 [Galerina marginata CBS 339.88]|uniref:CENP-C homolog n=1 Tax=Galerina marginata (strain CBS 339.88) TaxID=685588 RepID=A0A067T1B7_GALM3|nr:hypothetical protein GALMADRAFT_251561 [Galerina marginata CBS 339.88]